jgi:hypothetical protein
VPVETKPRKKVVRKKSKKRVDGAAAGAGAGAGAAVDDTSGRGDAFSPVMSAGREAALSPTEAAGGPDSVDAEGTRTSDAADRALSPSPKREEPAVAASPRREPEMFAAVESDSLAEPVPPAAAAELPTASPVRSGDSVPPTHAAQQQQQQQQLSQAPTSHDDSAEGWDRLSRSEPPPEPRAEAEDWQQVDQLHGALPMSPPRRSELLCAVQAGLAAVVVDAAAVVSESTSSRSARADRQLGEGGSAAAALGTSGLQWAGARGTVGGVSGPVAMLDYLRQARQARAPRVEAQAARRGTEAGPGALREQHGDFEVVMRQPIMPLYQYGEGAAGRAAREPQNRSPVAPTSPFSRAVGSPRNVEWPPQRVAPDEPLPPYPTDVEAYRAVHVTGAARAPWMPSRASTQAPSCETERARRWQAARSPDAAPRRRGI